MANSKYTCPDCNKSMDMNKKSSHSCTEAGLTVCDTCGDELEEAVEHECNKEIEPEVTTSVGEGANQIAPDVDLEVTVLGSPKEATLCESMHILEEVGNTGLDWRVVMISPGVSKNRTYYSSSLLRKKVSMFEGVRAFADHNEANPSNRSIKDVVGWYDDVKYEDGKGITGTFHAMESQPWFSGMLREAHGRGKPNLIGFSINGLGSKRLGKVNNETCYVIEDLTRIDSVDAVLNPSAGGKIIRLVAGVDGSEEEIKLLENMTLEELKTTRPDLYKEIMESRDSEVQEAVAKAQELEAALETAKAEAEAARVAAEAEAAKNTTVVEGEDPNKEEATRMNEEVSKLEEQMKAQVDRMNEMVTEAENRARVAECKATVKEQLAASDLPDPVRKKIARRFDGKIFEAQELEDAIKEEKDTLDALMSDKNQPYSRTASNVTVGDDQKDRAIKALDGFFDGKAVDGVAPARSLTEAFCIYTGKNSWEVSAQNLVTEASRTYDSGSRLQEALSAASWAEVLGDSITRKMLKEYRDLGYNEWRTFSEVVPVNDFRTQRRTRFGGYGLLATVAEAASYAAMSSPTDEEATYSPSKRGGTENITLEMIAKDDVGSIRRIPTKLARAAKITLYRFVFDMISLTGASAVTLTYDSTKLFTTAHANSVTSATGVDAALNDALVTTAKQKMAKQAAYAESTHIVGLRPKYLVTSVDNEATAIRLRDNEVTLANPATPATAGGYSQTDVNVHRGSFELITVPYWADDTDGRADRWVMIADPNDVPTIEIGFFQGREDPELFTQDMETVGSMFNNDSVTYKIRHIYGGTILDHRGFVGSSLFA